MAPICRAAAATSGLIARYQAPPAEWHDPMLLVGIRRTAASRSTDDAARYAWPLGERTLKRVRYMLVVKDLLIVDEFRPTRWLPATLVHFPEPSRP